MAQIRLDDDKKLKTEETEIITVDMLKSGFLSLQTEARSFMNSYKFMKNRERATKLQKLALGFGKIKRQIEQFRSQTNLTTNAKFGFETFRQAYMSFYPRWKRFEAELMGGMDKD